MNTIAFDTGRCVCAGPGSLSMGNHLEKLKCLISTRVLLRSHIIINDFVYKRRISTSFEGLYIFIIANFSTAPCACRYVACTQYIIMFSIYACNIQVQLLHYSNKVRFAAVVVSRAFNLRPDRIIITCVLSCRFLRINCKNKEIKKNNGLQKAKTIELYYYILYCNTATTGAQLVHSLRARCVFKKKNCMYYNTRSNARVRGT